MRCLSLLLLCSCSAEVASSGEPASVRERLERDETALAISSADSAGTITALRKTSDDWSSGFVDLGIASGELAASADGDGAITLERFELAIDPIDIPESVLGYPVQLTDVHLSAKPVRAVTTWSGDDEAHAALDLDLELQWSLTNHGTTSPLGAPDLPPVPAELVLTGDGTIVHAELRVSAPGELWSWADLIKLTDLTLIVSADSVR